MWDYLMPCKESKFAKSVKMDYSSGGFRNLERGVQPLHGVRSAPENFWVAMPTFSHDY